MSSGAFYEVLASTKSEQILTELDGAKFSPCEPSSVMLLENRFAMRFQYRYLSMSLSNQDINNFDQETCLWLK